jgi:hypothetical protein
MAILKHEVWIDKEGLTTLCLADRRGDGCRQLMDNDCKIIHTFYAESQFEAMTLYYSFMGWGEYQTNFESDKIPYEKMNSA